MGACQQDRGNHFWTAFAASALAVCITTCGIYVLRRFEAWGRQNTTCWACFAAGVLISVLFLHIIPTAFSMAVHGPDCLLIGYLFFHIFNRFITAYICDRLTTAQYAIGLVPMLGIGFHSFIDGTIYTVTFSVSVFAGMLATFGMVLHELPGGIVTYVLLVRAGFSDRKAFLLAFLAASLTTPLGTLVSYPVISRLDRPFLGVLLSLSAGALVYVGATHLLPRTETEPRRYSLLALTGGVSVAVGIVFTKG